MLKSSILCAVLLSSSAMAAEKTWMVENFEAIRTGGSHEYTVTTGKAQRVTATGKQDAIDELEVRVEGRTLKIGTRGSAGSWIPWSDKNASLKIAITVPKLTNASLSGAGKMAVNMVKGDRVNLSVSGSGDLSVGRIEADDVKLSISGSGEMIVTGKCRDGDISISGSGTLDASRLACTSLDTSISGSGDMAANAARTAKVSVSGSGDATVTGGAKCETRISGSGRVDCR